MDPDGYDYLRQLRQAARDPRYLRWLPGSHERVSFPLHGYTWVEDNRVIGNLTLIPFYHKDRWLYLIANVAVHPDFRRQGIARHLTQKALNHIRDHGASSAWLQVREENQAAIDLYLSLGMIKRSHRTTWLSTADLPEEKTADAGISVRPRRPKDWTDQRTWLGNCYPPQVSWNLSLDVDAFKPSLYNRINQFINHEKRTHWAVTWHDKLIGVSTWDPSRRYADNLWLAAGPALTEEAIFHMLDHARRTLPQRQPLMVNFSSSASKAPFLNAGFKLLNTLIWMEMKFKTPNQPD